MNPVQSQIAYFMSRMPTKQDRRAWRHHYLHRAEQLEKEWPTEYQGLAEALKEALRTQQPEKPAR
jgi:hypothetical protein